MDLQAALECAEKLNNQLKYDRVTVHTCEGQTGVLVTRVPAACYHLHPQDDRFQQGSILIFVEDELVPEEFEARLYKAIAKIEANFCEVYPNELQERLRLIRKWAH